MSSWPLLLSGLTPSAAGPDPGTAPLTADAPSQLGDEDIVVMARKFKRWRGKVKMKGETPVCKTVRTSKDAAFDTYMCGVLAACFVESLDEYRASEKLSRRDRKPLLERASAKLGQCVSAKNPENRVAATGT